MKVLIVDDNAAMRRLIRRLALSPVADCFECADGAAALVATQRLRANHPEARVVIVTRHDDDELRSAAFRHGAYGFVPKENILALRTLLNATA
jgi:DNA-binding NarL/FixJ family response regulator